MSTSYIPTKDSLLALWEANFASVIAANPAAYGLTAADAATITAASNAYNAAYNLLTVPGTRTSPNVAAKDIAKASSLITMRGYAQAIQANAGVSSAAKSAAGLTVRATSRTAIPAPGTAPILKLIGATPGSLTLAYTDTATPDSKKKPYGAIQIEIWTAYGTAPVTDPTVATFEGLHTRSPLALTMAPANRGQIVTLFGRWATRRGLVGPWSAPISATVS